MTGSQGTDPSVPVPAWRDFPEAMGDVMGKLAASLELLLAAVEELGL